MTYYVNHCEKRRLIEAEKLGEEDAKLITFTRRVAKNQDFSLKRMFRTI